jgi:energy-coupling factor transporter ATP-binding protein EcfA2
MITSITLQNFRAFQSEISVRIRPITVLIGKNSAGKSSLIKFLLMLRQTLESQSDEFFVTDGKYVQLGTWIDSRHTRAREIPFLNNNFRYKIDLKTSDLPPSEMRQLWEAAASGRLVTTVGHKQFLNVELKKEPIVREPAVVSFQIRGRVFYGKKFKSGDHEVEGRIGEQIMFKKTATNLERASFLRFVSRSDSIDKLIESTAAERFLEPLRYEFLSQRHLSPVREESQKTVQTGSPPSSDVGDRGEYAIPHLVRIFASPASRKEADFITEYAGRVADIEGIKFSSQVARFLTHIKARNRQTDAVSSLADFGFGVSQCLPIFVQGAMQHPGQLLMVEQPEAQLHPTAQLEMGSFFADLWKKREVPSLVETHSGNILLRLRRLVKERILTPEDVSVAFFTIGESSAKRGKPFKTVVVKNLDINDDGSMSKGLPMEFFGADVLEALELGAR